MRLFPFVLALVVVASAAFAQERNWQSVRDDKGVYTALLPGKSEAYSEKSAKGEAAGHHIELDSGAHYYDVYWTDAPNAPQDRAEQAKYLKARIEDSVAAANGTVLAYQPITLSGFVGAEAIVDFPAMGGRLRQRHFAVELRVVQQTWSGPPGAETSSEVEKFFDSLKLKP